MRRTRQEERVFREGTSVTLHTIVGFLVGSVFKILLYTSEIELEIGHPPGRLESGRSKVFKSFRTLVPGVEADALRSVFSISWSKSRTIEF